MNSFILILLVIATLTAQYFLSSSHKRYLGAVIPVLFVVGLTWMFISNHIESFLAYILILIVGTIFLLEQWSDGRKKLRKTRQEELNKMKTHDLK